MAFTHIQGNSSLNGGSGTAVTVGLSVAPTLGNLVCIAVCFILGGSSNLTVKDSNNNVYTVTPLSPSPLQTGQVYLAYLLSAPSNASATINISWTGSVATLPGAWAEEFHATSQIFFDFDVAANSAASATTINTPSITPTNTASLLFAASFGGGTITAPASSAGLGIWTGSDGTERNGCMAEFLLSSAAGASAVQYTQSSGVWSGMVMAFTLTPPPVVLADGFGDEYQWLGGDEY